MSVMVNNRSDSMVLMNNAVRDFAVRHGFSPKHVSDVEWYSSCIGYEGDKGNLITGFVKATGDFEVIFIEKPLHKKGTHRVSIATVDELPKLNSIMRKWMVSFDKKNRK